MQELKLCERLTSTYHPRPHFHTQSAVCLLSLAGEGVTKSTILFEAVVISAVATLSSICALNYLSTIYSIASTILNATVNHAVKICIH